MRGAVPLMLRPDLIAKSPTQHLLGPAPCGLGRRSAFARLRPANAKQDDPAAEMSFARIAFDPFAAEGDVVLRARCANAAYVFPTGHIGLWRMVSPEHLQVILGSGREQRGHRLPDSPRRVLNLGVCEQERGRGGNSDPHPDPVVVDLQAASEQPRCDKRCVAVALELRTRLTTRFHDRPPDAPSSSSGSNST